MKRQIKIMREMEEISKPLFETRNFHGYFQVIEAFDVNDKETYRWRFYITGFLFDDLHAHILRWDKTEEQVPIDTNGRILVDGKWYGREYWNH